MPPNGFRVCPEGRSTSAHGFTLDPVTTLTPRAIRSTTPSLLDLDPIVLRVPLYAIAFVTTAAFHHVNIDLVIIAWITLAFAFAGVGDGAK